MAQSSRWRHLAACGYGDAAIAYYHKFNRGFQRLLEHRYAFLQTAVGKVRS